MTAEVLETDAPTASGGPRGPLGVDDRRGRGDGSDGVADPRRFGLWAFLATVSMLFIGFTSAYILRKGGGDWRPLSPPGLLWVNTAMLMASSLTLELARHRFRGWELRGALRLIVATGLLGALFLLGQVAAWRQLAAQGIFLATNPHSSFFYLLTGVHGVHLFGGLLWFAVVLSRLRRMAEVPGDQGLALFATYWHFLGAVWIYLLFLLFVL